jgi:hypothetical protein
MISKSLPGRREFAAWVGLRVGSEVAQREAPPGANLARGPVDTPASTDYCDRQMRCPQREASLPALGRAGRLQQ